MSLIANKIATELEIKIEQVEAAVKLLDDGNTVPFIARYRKEVTNGLTDSQLRDLEERLVYLREFIARKEVILKEIEGQGKLTAELRVLIDAADNKARLEDLYKPYKPKRKTRGQIAINAGLQPLAESLFKDPTLDPESTAAEYLNAEHEINDTKAALDGARYILMEQFADDPNLVGSLRECLWEHGSLSSAVKEGKENEGKKFADYFAFNEKLNIVPSHRALAVLRGRNAGFLQISLNADYEFEADIAAYFGIENAGRPADKWLLDVVKWTWQIKLKLQLEVELISRLREISEQQAISVFAANLRDLLMMSPAGERTTMGLDPGFKTGVKVVVVNNTGKLVHSTAIFPHAPQKQWDKSLAELAQICKEHTVDLISIGNGTASRETDQLVGELLAKHPELNLTKIVVSEAGASVYSASKLAAQEFPDLDVTLRGAVSIARRLQDPLAELVKIEPKSIGVGQYQHDVNQSQLSRSLDAVVEDCVNFVGVDLNTASSALLARVAGLNQQIAENIVSFRNQHGPFSEREQLLQVSRLGPKAFLQAAGFLRIMQGKNPLDSSAVHPESYDCVNKILAKLDKDIIELLGNSELLKSLHAKDFVDDKYGLPTVQDIITELEKPGRDPRPGFKTANFNADVTSLQDLKPDMILEGVVTNVANFGAFVDIGVHQDGLVHISALANKFVKDPRDFVKAGDIVKVKVLEVDLERKRISLSMRLQATANNDAMKSSKPATKNIAKAKNSARSNKNKDKTSVFGAALMNALGSRSAEPVE